MYIVLHGPLPYSQGDAITTTIITNNKMREGT